jgi:hypothetical protein
MTASALALVLLSDDLPLARRERIAGITALFLVAVSGVVERAWLPSAPDSYEAIIHAPSG